MAIAAPKQNIWLSAIIVIIVFSICSFILLALYKLTSSEFVLGVAGLVGTIIGASYQFRKAKEREAESRLFSEKSKIYSEMIHSIIGIFKSAKGMSGEIDPDELAEKWVDIRAQLIVWGSFSSISAIDGLGDVDENVPIEPKEMLERLGNIYSAIRKDLGHKDPPGSGLQIALGQIIAKDRAKFT